MQRDHQTSSEVPPPGKSPLSDPRRQIRVLALPHPRGLISLFGFSVSTSGRSDGKWEVHSLRLSIGHCLRYFSSEGPESGGALPTAPSQS